ncbi:MAG: acyl-CoA dehydrogenase family protein [Polyangiales bacterium]
MPEMLDGAQRDLLARVQAFVDTELRPLELSLPDDPDASVPDDVRRTVIARARHAGLYGALQPVAVGGAALPPLERVLLIETLSRSNLRVARHVLGPGPGMLAGVSGALRERYLLPLLAGEKRSALAITEPRDPSLRTIAQRNEGTLRVRGTKSYVTSGADADFYLVMVALEEPSSGAGRRALLIVDRDSPGLSIVRRFRSLDGSHHVELRFEDVVVPESQLLPEAPTGASRAQTGIAEMRLQVAARATGGAGFALDHTRARLLEPHRNKALGEDPAVRLRVADMGLALYAARSALYRAARVLGRGEDARNHAIAAKVLCTESAVRVVASAIAVAGGQALVAGHPLERLHRELQALLLTEGASDVLRQSLAKGMLEHGFGL